MKSESLEDLKGYFLKIASAREQNDSHRTIERIHKLVSHLEIAWAPICLWSPEGKQEVK